MVNKIKASLELSLLIIFLSIFLVFIAIYGIVEIRTINKNSEGLFADRILPMDQLSDIRYYASSVLSTTYQAKNKEISFHEAQKKIKQAQDSINANWAAYNTTYLTPEEKLLEVKTTAPIKKFNSTLEKLKVLLQNNDEVALENIIKNDLNKDFIAVFIKINQLRNIQIKVAKTIHTENTNLYKTHIQVILIAILVLFAFLVPISVSLIRKYKRIINSYNLSNVKLFLTEKKFRNFIEYAGDPILILDSTTGIIDLNESACELFGYSRNELLKMDITDLVPDDELKKQAEDILRIRKENFGVLNRTIKRKDGTLLNTEISNRLIEDKGFFAIIRDVTERKKAEEALRVSEFQFRYLFDHNPAYIIIWDLKTLEVLKINEVVFQKYGYSRDEWNTMKVTDFRPEEDYQKIKDFAEMMLINDEPIAKRTWRHIKKSGEIMLMDISSHKLKYEGRTVILSLGRDVTEQIKAERALAEREAQLNLFIEHSPASLAMFDNDMRYIATSRRWISDYNLGDIDIIGMSHYDVFPEITQEWKDIHKRSLAGEIIKREDDCFVRKDGRIEWLRGEIRPWFKVSGEIGGIIVFAEVITEQKKATELFKHQFENSPDLILYVNRFHIIENINRADAVTGKTREDFIGQNCIEVLPEASKKKALEALMNCFETGKQQEIENELTHGRFVRSRFVPIILNEEVTHVMIFATDITDRKKFEVKLLQSEEKYRVLTENVSDAVILVNQDFQISYQNPSAEQISGYKIEEVINKTLFSLVYPEDQIEAIRFFKSIKESPNVQLQNQFRIIRKTGEVIWVEGSIINLVENESIGTYIINYRDVTSRKKFEEQQFLITSIVNSSDDAIISKSLDGIITSWNKGAEKTLGYRADEIIGKHISTLIPLDVRGEESSILKDVQEGNSLDHYETKRMKKNGEIIDVSLTISPIKDDSGIVVGASKIMRDITDRKNFEDELIKYNNELKKTNEELDRFVYSTSHDLRAPLKSILGLINITKATLEERNDCDVAEIVLERMNMLNKSAIKLDNFIEDILTYSRNARMGLDLEVLDLKELINDVKMNLKFAENAQEIDFSLVMMYEDKFVSDRKRLSVVLNNILSNAYKYSDVTKENQYIHVTITGENKNIIIVIEDNGIGIAETEIEKVFDMFYRSTTLSTGSGLGLYIAKEAIEKLEGTIKVKSENKKGTKFIIEIPNKYESEFL